jgi:hypothetical protein
MAWTVILYVVIFATSVGGGGVHSIDSNLKPFTSQLEVPGATVLEASKELYRHVSFRRLYRHIRRTIWDGKSTGHQSSRKV